jgi:predicted DNA binding CopG/RHH family protein
MSRIPDPSKMKRVKGFTMTRKQLERAKVRITTHLDSDLLDLIRRVATESGGKYQAVLNQILRRALLGEGEGLLARIERLEKAVFKNKAA